MKRAIIVLAVAALAACSKDEKTDTSKAETPATAQPESKNVTTTAAAPVTIADGDLATPADFEETAEKAITKANYKTELASLETDIAKE